MADQEPHIYTAADIDRYLNGGMTAKDMHDMERAALGDPFLFDAIEGFRNADGQQTTRHLNEVSAAIHAKKPAARVIRMRPKKTFLWQVAIASVIVIALGVFLFYKQSNKEAIALAKERKPVKKNDTTAPIIEAQPSPAPDTLLAAAKPLDINLLNKKSKAVKREKGAEPLGATSYTKKNNQPSAAAAPKATTTSQSKIEDTTAGEVAMSEVTDYQSRFAAPAAESFVLVKEKPFMLSQVEEISLGKKRKKPADTASLKPEVGWQNFQDYLIGKLYLKDTVSFTNTTPSDNHLELEFSLSESGIPYGVQVLRAKDSMVAKRAAAAIKNGPKWISRDKQKKRISLSY